MEIVSLVAMIDFALRSLKALKFQEHLDYTITYNAEKTGRDQIKCIVAIEIHKSHRQLIQYVKPEDTDKFTTAELVAIDEAAAIPLPTVKALMGDRLTFMSSTINGYGGTGKALSFKLIKELRDSETRGVIDAAKEAAKADLFSYHKLSETFLQKVMGLYTSTHYKNTPNDLQMLTLSDAPSHSIFALLSPSVEDSDLLPDILAVV